MLRVYTSRWRGMAGVGWYTCRHVDCSTRHAILLDLELLEYVVELEVRKLFLNLGNRVFGRVLGKW